MDGIFGRLQFAANGRRVLIDLCADLCDVDGFPRAVTSPCVSDSKRPYWLLERAIEVAETTDERQPALWGVATHAVSVRPTRRANARPKLQLARAGRDPRTLSVYPSAVD